MGKERACGSVVCPSSGKATGYTRLPMRVRGCVTEEWVIAARPLSQGTPTQGVTRLHVSFSFFSFFGLGNCAS